jgi:hypothetical protein
VSAQKRALVDLAVRTRLYVDHCDAFLMEQTSLILKRKKSVLPILLQRNQLADSLARTLSMLGLERIPLPISDRFSRAQEELRKIGESKTDDDEPEKNDEDTGA